MYLRTERNFLLINTALIYLVSDVHVKVNYTCIYMYVYTIYYGLINYLIWYVAFFSLLKSVFVFYLFADINKGNKNFVPSVFVCSSVQFSSSCHPCIHLTFVLCNCVFSPVLMCSLCSPWIYDFRITVIWILYLPAFFVPCCTTIMYSNFFYVLA